MQNGVNINQFVSERVFILSSNGDGEWRVKDTDPVPGRLGWGQRRKVIDTHVVAKV